ncbi:MAG: protein-disulfide reductase DsbD family protein [candidate division Zixibacteria bacterium]|nr:protein-disulfide reductase DsbD family protein [candidate division Zixibacteria bacterium]
MKRLAYLVLIAIALGLFSTQTVSSEPTRVGHVEAELISELTSLQPGQTTWLALRFTIDPEWHLYWKNPGDAGLPPKVKWVLPTGFEAGELQFPYPERFDMPPLVSFSYEKELILPVKITVPKMLGLNAQVTLQADVTWLVCKESCIPGKTSLTLTLPVQSEVPKFDDRWIAAFNDTRFDLPIVLPDWKLGAHFKDSAFVLSITAPTGSETKVADIIFFPEEQELLDYSAAQVLTPMGEGYSLKLKRSPMNLELPERLTGILVNEHGWRGEGSEKALVVDVSLSEPEQITGAASKISGPLQALLFSFIGGLILNLMPCVLPVLSLKIFGFVKQAGEDKSKVLNHGLTFTAGVLISFWILAGALLLLRAGGEQLGWGFQLQSPTFVVIISAFMFLFALNLLGVFEIGTSLTAVGGASASRTGYSGSFLNGVTATIVATPCTAPFMGPALGYALTQPPWLSMLIFTFVGLGMSSPYIILSASPRLLKFLPKPGQWMESLKQFMGFLLMATVLFLAYILGAQVGLIGVLFLFAGLLILAIAAWVYGRWGHFAASARSKLIASVTTVVLIAIGLGLTLSFVSSSEPTTLQAATGLPWEVYSPERLAELRQSNTPVFIDFTAAWCLSCQVNERVALHSQEIVDKFASLGVVPLKADWTNRSEQITQALAQFNRNSVPLYILYDKNNKSPIILPEILTPGIVMDALNNLSQ